MKNVNVSIEAMGVICNIQGMRAIINTGDYDAIRDFQSLQVYDVETLRALQAETIPLYNKAIYKRRK